MRKTLHKYSLHLTIVVLLLIIGIPATLFVMGNQTNLRSKATASTTLQFSPMTSSSNPFSGTVGTTIPLDIYINPNSNILSYISLEITYNPTYFDPSNVVFISNAQSTLQVREGPVYTNGKVRVSLDIGNNVDNAVRSQTKLGTITLRPIAKTSKRNSTQVTFGSNTTVLSLGAGDSAQENVLSTSMPAYISIAAAPRVRR